MGPPYNIARIKANRLYYDSLNFFFSDNEVKQKAWETVYATHLDNLAYFAIETNDIDTARRCFLDAAKMRGVGREEKAELPEEMFNRPVVIYTLDPKKVGIEPASRRELGHFIDNLPDISERERIRVKKDAGIIETTLFEETIEDAKKNTPKN